MKFAACCAPKRLHVTIPCRAEISNQSCSVTGAVSYTHLDVYKRQAFPCASKLLAQSFGIARLGIANGILSFGYLLGPAVGTLVGGLLLARFGWRPVFILFGACSLAWLLAWRLSLIHI